jgi:hypothetical protein
MDISKVFILEDVYVVEAIGVTHGQCMCESCHYYAKYCSKSMGFTDFEARRDQYYESWNNNLLKQNNGTCFLILGLVNTSLILYPKN